MKLRDNLFPYLSHDLRIQVFKLLRSKKYRSLQKLRYEKWGKHTISGFDKYKCIFVHVPKCAGTAVSRSLFNEGVGHTTLRNYQLIFNKDEFYKYFKFTFVRNPFDRVFSAYNFLKKGGLDRKDMEWASINLKDYATFEQFIKEGLRKPEVLSFIHFIPQHVFLTSYEGEVPIDFIGHYETLEKDFEFVCSKIGVSQKLESINVTNTQNRKYFRYYDPEMTEIIERVYKKDIQFFGYTFQ